MVVSRSHFVELARTILDIMNFKYRQTEDLIIQPIDRWHCEEFIKWFTTLAEQRFIDPHKYNSNLRRDYLQGGTGLGSTGSGVIMSSYTGGIGGIVVEREVNKLASSYTTGESEYIGITGYTGGVGYDYGLLSKSDYISSNGKLVDYKLFHNRYYPLRYNLGPNGQFNRDIYMYDPEYVPTTSGDGWDNKRFVLFHVSWDVFGDSKDEYTDDEYDTRMTYVEDINRALYPLTIYYLYLLFDEEYDIRDFLDDEFILYYENLRKLQSSGKGYNLEDGYYFYDDNGEPPFMKHHHDARYYRKDELLDVLYTPEETLSIFNSFINCIRIGDDPRYIRDDLFYPKDEFNSKFYVKSQVTDRVQELYDKILMQYHSIND